MLPMGMRPNNYMVLAIIGAIFCCLPIGIVAIIYASQVGLTLSLPCFSLKIKHEIYKIMNSVQQQREHHH